MESRDRIRAELALLLVCLIWGCNFTVMKIALRELDPFAFNAVRISLSALLLWVLHLRERSRPELNRADWLRIVGLSLLGYFAYQVLFLTGLARTTAANSSLLIASSPIFTGVLGFFLGERLRVRAWVGLTIACVGTAAIALQKGPVDFGGERLLGNLLSLGAAIAWGSYTALNRKSALVLPATSLAFYTTVVSLPLHLVLAWPHLDPIWNGSVGLGTWAAVTYSGLLSTGVAYALWNVGIRQVGASHTAVFVNLVPVIAVCIAWVWIGETVSTAQVVGGTAVLFGVWVMRRAR